MNTNEPMVEAASAASWKELVEPKSPARTWEVICAKEAEIAEAHRVSVRAHFECDFDLDRALLKISGGKTHRADWLERSVKFQEGLMAFLRTWARNNAG